jgi:hypothetical protein
MAVCRHCFKEKDFFASRCPHCTGESSLKQQANASISSAIGGVLGFLFVIWVISLIIG